MLTYLVVFAFGGWYGDIRAALLEVVRLGYEHGVRQIRSSQVKNDFRAGPKSNSRFGIAGASRELKWVYDSRHLS